MKSLQENAYAYRYIYPVLLVLAGLLTYYPVIGHQFLLFWDDQWVVLNYYTEGGLNPENFWDILTDFYHGQYAPFNEYLYLLLYNLAGGYHPAVFHVASLLLHLGNMLWVYVILRSLLPLCTSWSRPKNDVAAFFTALIFGIHPFNVESVAWISASKILVYAFFYFWATYMLLRYVRTGKAVHYLAVLLLFACSFLGKEQAVTFPLWMLLLFWIVGRPMARKRVWLETLPFFALSLFFGILTIRSQLPSDGTPYTPSDAYPFWQRIVYACYTFWEYLIKCFCPVKLSYLYPFPSEPGEPLPSWLLVYPLLMVTVIVGFWRFLLRKPVVFCLLFFIIHIAVALHLMPLSRFAVVADRYAYVASIGVTFFLTYAGMWLYGKFPGNKALHILTLCYLLAMGGYANWRSRAWYDTDSIKKEVRELIEQRDALPEERKE